MLYSTHTPDAATKLPSGEAEVKKALAEIRATLVRRDSNQPEFLQAYDEVAQSLLPVFVKDPKYIKVLEAIAEPERVVMFRVNWVDDHGRVQTNRGYRVQFNSAIGPYKGGLRLHPSVNLGVLKFLGFEQIFKNSLTGLAMGGGKGGSDFDPKGKSDNEVKAFCTSFMSELFRHIGPDTDVPAGDIGTGGREIGFLFGQYRRLTNTFTGTLTGKGAHWGGSLARPEATGYGAVYFAECMVDSMSGKKALVSGSGNAAQYCAEKLIQLGAKVVTMSDSNGTLEFTNGMTADDLKAVLELKNVKRGRISELAGTLKNVKYHEGKKPWGLFGSGIDLAFPSATQNEINEEDAKALKKAGVKAVVEVANMPSTAEAVAVYKKEGIMYAPGKAANAGGVGVSGMEMAQNSSRCPWSFEEVDAKLKQMMRDIHARVTKAAADYGHPGDLEMGANIAGFLKVADSMIEQGML